LGDYNEIITRIHGQSAPATVVVAPYAHEALGALRGAYEATSPQIYLTGDSDTLTPLVRSSGLDPSRIEIVHCATDAEAVTAAARLVMGGQADFVVKGSVTTAELLKGLLGKDRLGIGRVASHLYVIEAPAYANQTIAFADAGVNIRPDLTVKADIIKNSADALSRLGVVVPRIAVLSAVEHVKASVASSLDAALLTQMGRRGQLGNVEVDGPISIDAALSPAAAAAKSLRGPVAGNADLIVAPDIDAANMTSKALIGTVGRAMGVVLGARVPIALPSRGDSMQTRSDSLMLASYLSGHAVAAAV
jgi:phosphotransacetylase